jgi:hypothetical protein
LCVPFVVHSGLTKEGAIMTLRKSIAAAIILVAGAMAAAPAGAVTVNDLYGTWNGTYTPLPTPAPLFVTPGGTIPYNPAPGFFGPQPAAFSFVPSAPFAFGFVYGSITPPPGLSFLPRVQTGATANGNTFTWSTFVEVPLLDGTELNAASEAYTATLTPDPADPQSFLLTGHIIETQLVPDLPSDATLNVVIADRDFSVGFTAALPTTTPEPATAALGLLGLGALGLAVLRRR